MSYCDNCPLRLYNKVNYINGVGDTYYGNCIVLPNIDRETYKKRSVKYSEHIKIIKDILSTNSESKEDKFYIIPLIRCYNNSNYEIDDIVYQKCIHYFMLDLMKYNFKNILLLGQAAIKFLGINNISNNLNNCYVTNNRKYFINYSPFTINNDVYAERFKEYLIKWYNYINKVPVDKYNLIKL